MNTSVPDELIINIDTSIPGYEKIKFSPSMLSQNMNTSNRNVLFNPLYKLDAKNMGDISEKSTKTRFYDINSFNSMLSLFVKTRVNSLKEAVNKGYIDNNIKITLDVIFSDKSVIYIGGKPYTIMDHQWTLGNWNIDKKIKIENPNLNTKIKNEIISGDESVFYGPNYSGTKNTKPMSSSISSVNNSVISSSNVANVANGVRNSVATGISKSSSEPINKAVISPQSTRFMKNFFVNNNFYMLINELYKACNQDTKDLFNRNLQQMSGLNIPKGEVDLNVRAYNSSVNGLKIFSNSGAGDCFFIAVADAINNHNYYNQGDKIVSGIYGTGSNLFTQSHLRSLVSRFITNWEGLDNFLKNIAQINADNLNTLFINQLNGIKQALRDSGKDDDISEENYVKIANDIYKANDNFMIKNITGISIDIDDYDAPFKVLNKSEINNYILSNNYWANELAINAMASELHLNVILIEKTNDKQPLLRIPFANFDNIYNDWNKYLFLFYSNNHYEAISFDYKGLASSKVNPTKYIFNRDDRKFDPPIYILFLILGSYFSAIVDIEDKNNFTFQKPIMEAMNNIINNRVTAMPNYNAVFYAPFKLYFPDSRIYRPAYVGGADPNDVYYPTYNNPTYYNPRYNNPRYNNQSYNSPSYNYSRNNYPSQDNSDYAYYITISLELYPGTSIPPEDEKGMSCNKKWNSIKKAYSEFTGSSYKPGSLYKTKTANTKQNRSQNTTKKYRKY
jgi:hypothetical protein